MIENLSLKENEGPWFYLYLGCRESGLHIHCQPCQRAQLWGHTVFDLSLQTHKTK